METISRRQFLCLVSTSLALVSPTSLALASTRENNQKEENRFPKKLLRKNIPILPIFSPHLDYPKRYMQITTKRYSDH